MPLKLVSRNNKPVEQPQEAGFITRNIVNPVTAAVGSVPSLVQGLGEEFKEYLPSHRGGRPDITEEIIQGVPGTIPKLRESAASALGVTPESLQPQGFFEKTIDKTAQALPFIYGLGGSLGTLDLASSAGMAAADEAGLGPLGEIAGGILGPVALRKIQSMRGKPSSIPHLEELANKAKENFYEKEAKLGSKINVPSKKYVEGLNKIASKVEDNTALSLSEKTEIMNKLDQFRNDAAFGTINAAKLVQREKELNALYPSIQGPKDRIYREFIGQTRNHIENFGKEIGNKHPDWLHSWQNAKDIVKAQNYQSGLSQLIDEYPTISKAISNPLVKGLLGIGAGSYLGGPVGAGVAVGGSLGFKKAERLYAYYKRPIGQKLLKEAFKNIYDRNVPALERTLVKLNKDVEKFEEENPEKPMGQLRLVSRRNKSK